MLSLDEKRTADKVVKLLSELAGAWYQLPETIQQAVNDDLAGGVRGYSLRTLADKVDGLAKFKGYCERKGCHEVLKGKGSGHKQRFCSADCRMKWHNEQKRKADNQPTEQADNGAAGQLTSQVKEGDSSEQAKPLNAKKEKRIKAESQADNGGAGDSHFVMTEQRAPFVPTCPKCNGNATKLKIYDGVLHCTDCGQIPMRDSFVAILKDLTVTHADCPNCHNHVYTLRDYDKLVFFCLTCDKRLEKIQADNGGAGELTSEESMPDSTADNRAIEATIKPSGGATISIKEAVKILNREGNKVRRDHKTGLYFANGTKRSQADIIAWAMELKG